MFKESVQLISTRCAPFPCGFTDDAIGILATELIRHHTPECIEWISLFGFICVGRREVGADKNRDVGIKGRVVIPFRFLQDVLYFFSKPLVFTVRWKFSQDVNSGNQMIESNETVGFPTSEASFELDNWVAHFATKPLEGIHQQLAKPRGDVRLIEKDIRFAVF